MFSDWRDRLGVCLSALCMAHCLLTPLVLAVVPLGTAIGFWHSGVHLVFLFVVPLIAAIAFIPGWRLHRNSRVWIFAAIGFVFLLTGSQVGLLFGAEQVMHAGHLSLDGLHDAETHGFKWGALAAELFFTSLGGFFFIRAHLLNRKLCACCNKHKHSSDHAHDPPVVV
ncbi:MAG: MerC domain-containing protein [Deltaproteobacteria bacterium]|nr:MerC domain-containing protein [Deltaproteobacteria bacterium]